MGGSTTFIGKRDCLVQQQELCRNAIYSLCLRPFQNRRDSSTLQTQVMTYSLMQRAKVQGLNQREHNRLLFFCVRVGESIVW